jgi:hypothetical protein
MDSQFTTCDMMHDPWEGLLIVAGAELRSSRSYRTVRVFSSQRACERGSRFSLLIIPAKWYI